jgi:hypothetical protein
MKFKLSCIIDAELVGPLVELIGPYSQVALKMVEPGTDDKSGTLIHPTPITVQRTHRRVTRFNPDKGIGTVLILKTIEHIGGQVHVSAVKKALLEAGKSGNGSGATLSKLKRDGYVKNVGKGLWAITPKGETAAKHISIPVAVLHGEVLERVD